MHQRDEPEDPKDLLRILPAALRQKLND
jgi:hypothetical protein